MPIVSEQYSKVVGVDCHAATNTLAVIDATTGAELDSATFPTTTSGSARAVTWVLRRVEAASVLCVVEGIGSYGAGIARTLTAAHLQVVEPSVMAKSEHRGRGKSDPLDSVRIAKSVLGVTLSRLRQPRQDGGHRTALQVLIGARQQMSTERTKLINTLTALLRMIDLGIDSRHPLTGPQIAMITRWRTRPAESIAMSTSRREAVRLAGHITVLNAELHDNRTQLDALVADHAPQLQEMMGIGAVVAATVLVAWSHPGRVRSEAAFASLAGTCPIPASSGNTVRHRLNRGGDRQLNRVITTIALVRMRCDPETRAYVAKRTAEGRTKKETMRSLKRYITRQLFRALTPKPVAAST